MFRKFSRRRALYFSGIVRLKRILRSCLPDAYQEARVMRLERFIRIRTARTVRKAIRSMRSIRPHLRKMRGLLLRARNWRHLPARKRRRGINPWKTQHHRLWVKPLYSITKALRIAQSHMGRRGRFLIKVREQLPMLFVSMRGPYRHFVEKIRRLRRKHVYRFKRRRSRWLPRRRLRKRNKRKFVHSLKLVRDTKRINAKLTRLPVASLQPQKWKRRANRRHTFHRNRNANLQPILRGLQIQNVPGNWTARRILRQRVKVYRAIFNVKKFQWDLNTSSRTIYLRRRDRALYRRYYVWTLSSLYGQIRERRWQSLKLKVDLNGCHYNKLDQRVPFRLAKLERKVSLQKRFVMRSKKWTMWKF